MVLVGNSLAKQKNCGQRTNLGYLIWALPWFTASDAGQVYALPKPDSSQSEHGGGPLLEGSDFMSLKVPPSNLCNSSDGASWPRGGGQCLWLRSL